MLFDVFLVRHEYVNFKSSFNFLGNFFNCWLPKCTAGKKKVNTCRQGFEHGALYCSCYITYVAYVSHLIVRLSAYVLLV